ncbi:hypothetical protein [Acidithiobacillus sulfurivorans]|uniref:Core-binding (CB) domain-containing protein n=1 Tax=Acidithiobacillus sulfurivorans TaxID=1958756 RepID=A0ABS6A0H2_9PROT|nr:hypothetical protein [Acidithiobacillus sulfurivorans]MBU2760872.1 hypothetical protein [Acidithiobacillus sulfurivorans]
MKTPTADHFERQYQTHLKHLKLKGLQPKTIEAYARAIRRIGNYVFRGHATANSSRGSALTM